MRQADFLNFSAELLKYFNGGANGSLNFILYPLNKVLFRHTDADTRQVDSVQVNFWHRIGHAC